MEAVLNEPEAKRATWGPAALEERRERTRNHLAKIAELDQPQQMLKAGKPALFH